MASLARIAVLSGRKICLNKALIPCSSRCYAYWNREWKPGPFPKTPKEREAAAKRYGLRPEDYEPYPDDGFGYGDYPKLPPTPADARDPNEIWDMPEMRRNYGEPLSVDFDMHSEDRYNPYTKYRFTWPQMYMMFAVCFGGWIVLTYLFHPYPYFRPAMPKQFPHQGEKHYSFEPVD